MIVLVDQDGVLADFEQHFYDTWRAAYPTAPAIPPTQRTTFYVSDQLPDEYRDAARAHCAAQGFFETMPPVPGAIDGIKAVAAAGHEVFICTAPLTAYRHCVAEKYAWVEHHLGLAWTKRMIVTKDKTLVRGDVLIDDRPAVTGIAAPTWQHLVFEAPYNADAAGMRFTWGDPLGLDIDTVMPAAGGR